jgi:O-antigen/teichoic acid export membrane protein
MSTLQALANRRPWTTGQRAFVEHYASTLVGQGFTLALGTVTGILAARMLGPVARGEYAAVVLWPMAIATFLSFGINQAIAYHVGRSAFTVSEVATAAGTLGFIQGALSILIGFLVVPFALEKYSPAIQHLGIVFLLFTPALILGGYPANLFQGRQDLLRFNVIRVAAPLLYLTGLVGLYFAGRGSLTAIIVCHLAGWLAALAIGSVTVGRILKPRIQWNSAAIPRLINFGARTQVTNLANYFNQRIDQLLLSLFVPPRQLGLYAVAVTLSIGVTVFPQALGIVTFSRGSSQPSDDAKRTIGVSFRAALLWLLIGCSLLYVLTPFLIRLLFGAAFDDSIVACRILLPGTLFIGLNQVLYNGASALGRPGLPSYAEGVSMAVTAIGLYLLVPRYGYIGAAIISSIAYSVSFLVTLVLLRRLFGLSLRFLLRG